MHADDLEYYSWSMCRWSNDICNIAYICIRLRLCQWWNNNKDFCEIIFSTLMKVIIDNRKNLFQFKLYSIQLIVYKYICLDYVAANHAMAYLTQASFSTYM